jgi:hypothetical protein
MNFGIDTLFADILQLFTFRSVDKIRRLRARVTSVREISISTSSVGDWKDHVVGRSHSVDFGVKSLFTNVSQRLEDEVRWLTLGRRTIREISIFTSSVRNGQNHVVGRGHAVNFGINSLLTNVSNRLVNKAGRLSLRIRAVRKIRIITSSMRDR